MGEKSASVYSLWKEFCVLMMDNCSLSSRYIALENFVYFFFGKETVQGEIIFQKDVWWIMLFAHAFWSPAYLPNGDFYYYYYKAGLQMCSVSDPLECILEIDLHNYLQDVKCWKEINLWYSKISLFSANGLFCLEMQKAFFVVSLHELRHVKIK